MRVEPLPRERRIAFPEEPWRQEEPDYAAAPGPSSTGCDDQWAADPEDEEPPVTNH